MLATTGTALIGLGGGAAGAAGAVGSAGVAGGVGAVLGPGGVVTGLTPIVGTLGLLGEDVIYEEQSQYSMSHWSRPCRDSPAADVILRKD